MFVVSAQPAVDSLKNVDVEEAVVVASPKETARFRRQPVSVSLFGEKELQSLGVTDMKGLSAYAPNFYMPDYGSRLTSAVYIRGIGSRINTPAVGLYVDNVPFADKSAYDFSFLDVERVDVLRGPQGTLYGRNSMGGLIRIFTADPLARKGGDVNIGASTRNGGRSVRTVMYLHPLSKFALSVGGFYEGQNGFYRNAASSEKADASDAGGGKVRAAWCPSDDLRFDLTASYEYSDEKACPYYFTGAGDESGGARPDVLENVIAQNRQSEYRRQLMNVGLSVSWNRPNLTMSSITSFQYLNDRLFMDQDFTAADIFSLEQTQRMRVLTQELSLKSVAGRRWQWTSGLFFMHEGMKTACPVNFYSDGTDYLNARFASALPAPMSLRLTDDVLPFGARFRTPVLNAALFHQSTVKLGGGLSAVVGARLDYDYRELRLASGTSVPVAYAFSMPPYMNAELQACPVLDGNLYDDSWQVLPKLALQYDHRSGRGNVYVAVSKGYRSGGYNIQSYSDLSQTVLRRAMMSGVQDYGAEVINRLPLPEEVKEKALAGMNAAINRNMPDRPSVRSLAYRPEQSWNYELGGHLLFFGQTLRMDYTFFYMNTKDQQLARFSDSGMGRIMVNAGKSRSCGAEVALRSSLFSRRLDLSLSYGYTSARLTEHDLGEAVEGERMDYSGNRVPFVPEHTFGASFVFRQPCSGRILKAFSAGMNLDAAGDFYWDEANSFGQPFYARVGAKLAVELPAGVSVELWGKNLTGTDYDTFAFESFGRRFAQRGVPRHFGADVRLHF